MKKIKILHYIPAFGYGGIEKLVINLYENIDKKEMQFDFLVECDIPDYAKQIIEKNDGKIIRIPKMTKIRYIFKYVKSLKKVFKENNYDVFYCHSLDTRPLPMIFAKKYNVKLRILHIHTNNFNNNRFYLIKKFFMLLGQKNANFFIGCSKRAAKSMLMKKNYKKAIIMNNGIITNDYKFDKMKRKKIRKELNIHSNTCLIACIGRMTYLKNQKFLFKVFKNSAKKVHIVFLGDGVDKKKLLKLANKNTNINAIFLGNVNNVNDYLSACDLVLMPSISEAMPLTAIELQVNGVPAIVSKAIDEEFIINSNVQRIDLNKNEWYKEINKKHLRVNKFDSKLTDKFDIKNIALKYQKIVLNNIAKR